MKKLLALTALLSTGAFASANVTVQPIQQNAIIGVQAIVISNHHVHIVNETNIAQRYQVFYTLCVQAHDCRNESETPTVQPGQAFDTGRSLKVAAVFHQRTNFSTEAVTEVRGESSARQQGSGVVVVR